MKHRFGWASLALSFAAVSTAGPAVYAQSTVSLPTNSVLKVKLNQTIDSGKAKAGDHFTAKVDDPSLPPGTVVRGTIIGVKPGTKDHPGQIGLDFRTLELTNGQRVAISGSPISLDSKSVKRSSDGRLIATSTTTHSSNDTGKYVAIGAAGGLIVGSLFGKNVIGGLLGAGAGYVLGKNKDKKTTSRNVVIKEGTPLGVRLDRSVTVARGGS